MTLVDLNQPEIELLISTLRIEINRLKEKPRNNHVTEQAIKEWINHIQSIIYKLEKAK